MSCVNSVRSVPPERGYSDYKVRVCCKRKISCTLDRLISQFNNLWPIMYILWPEFRDKNNNNLNFWQTIVSQYTISHPFLCEIIKIPLLHASTTEPSERSFNKLVKMCYEDRNKVLVKNLESLYLLRSLKSYKFDYNPAAMKMEN